MRISPELVTRIIPHWPVARLATISDDGTPHQVPIVYVFDAGQFWSPIDGKPKRGTSLQRVTNALANSSGSLLIDHYEDDWDCLWWIRVNVNIEVIRLDKTDASSSRLFEHTAQALKDKYPQYAKIEVLQDPPTLLSLQPRDIKSWCAADIDDQMYQHG